jgi:hypothetical protein
LQKIQFSTFSTGRKTVLWISLGNLADKRGALVSEIASDLCREPPTRAKATCERAGCKDAPPVFGAKTGVEGYVRKSLLSQPSVPT